LIEGTPQAKTPKLESPKTEVKSFAKANVVRKRSLFFVGFNPGETSLASAEHRKEVGGSLKPLTNVGRKIGESLKRPGAGDMPRGGCS